MPEGANKQFTHLSEPTSTVASVNPNCSPRRPILQRLIAGSSSRCPGSFRESFIGYEFRAWLPRFRKTGHVDHEDTSGTR